MPEVARRRAPAALSADPLRNVEDIKLAKERWMRAACEEFKDRGMPWCIYGFFFTDITWNNQTDVAAEFQIIAAGALQAHLSI